MMTTHKLVLGDGERTMLPALRCPRAECGHTWVPKGKMGPRRCPKCSAITVPEAQA